MNPANLQRSVADRSNASIKIKAHLVSDNRLLTVLSCDFCNALGSQCSYIQASAVATSRIHLSKLQHYACNSLNIQPTNQQQYFIIHTNPKSHLQRTRLPLHLTIGSFHVAFHLSLEPLKAYAAPPHHPATHEPASTFWC